MRETLNPPRAPMITDSPAPAKTHESLCHHDWQQAGVRINCDYLLDDWLGPVSFLSRCCHCGQYAMLRLIDWSVPQTTRRIYLLQALPREATSVYLRNMNSSYCDLARKQQETQALLSTASGPQHLLLLHLPALLIERTMALPAGEKPRPGPWQTHLPDAANLHWFNLLDAPKPDAPEHSARTGGAPTHKNDSQNIPQ